MIFDLKKTPFRQLFAIEINVFLCVKVLVSRYSTNTIMKKNKQTRGRVSVKDTEFSVNTIRTL